MISLVYLTESLERAPLTTGLVKAGCHVREASTVPEAIWQCTQGHISLVVIDIRFRHPELTLVQERYTSLRVHPDSPAEEVISRLEELRATA